MNNSLGASGINYAFLNDPQYNNMNNYGEQHFSQVHMNNQNLNYSTNQTDRMKPEISLESKSPNTNNSKI